MGDEASQTEIVISKFIAPVILSKVGKTIIVLIFLALTGLTSYACHMVQIDFSMGDYLLEGGESILSKFNDAKETLYPDYGLKTSFYTHNVTTNWLSEENQLRLMEFEDVIHRCKDCKKPWIQPNSLISWFKEFRWWVGQGRCEQIPLGYEDPFKKTLDSFNLTICFIDWFTYDNVGKTFLEDIKINLDTLNADGFIIHTTMKKIKGL